uniref:Cornifelin homolog B-like n=1 Tax=Phallusia mammillata TaxID=59560 RepID=A0A6F9D923_9ASCI|nr:cornifelin homolog B-like [Phallusia mammillata]
MAYTTTYHQSQPAVVVQQPVSQVTTTVVTQQPSGMKGWSSGQCDCFNDMKSCLCAFFLGNCFYCTISTRMGENCCVGCSGYGGGCIPGGHMAMRSRFRGTHNIQGSICDDCIVSSFCLPCAMCQLSREMDALGYASNC